MRKILLLTTLLFIGINTVLAKKISEAEKARVLLKVQKKVERMAKKGWTFYAYEGKQIYLLNGKYRYTKVSFDEFYMPRLFSRYSKEYRPSQVGKDVVYFYQKDFFIVMRRNGKFFRLKDGVIQQFDPLKEEIFDFNLDRAETYKRAQCKFCSVKLSFNSVTVGEAQQYNTEFAWLPYFSLTDTTGIRVSLGLSPYTVENDDLEEVVDAGIKSQVLFRQYFWNFFLEAGGGFLYFTQAADISAMGTIGLGYTFIDKHWIFTENLQFSNIFFHGSTISWDETINEAKIGIGLTF